MLPPAGRDRPAPGRLSRTGDRSNRPPRPRSGGRQRRSARTAWSRCPPPRHACRSLRCSRRWSNLPPARARAGTRGGHTVLASVRSSLRPRLYTASVVQHALVSLARPKGRGSGGVPRPRPTFFKPPLCNFLLTLHPGQRARVPTPAVDRGSGEPPRPTRLIASIALVVATVRCVPDGADLLGYHFGQIWFLQMRKFI